MTEGSRRDSQRKIRQAEYKESEQEPGRRILVRRGHLRKDITHLRLAIDPGQEKSLDGGEGQAVDGEIDLVRQSQGSILPEERLSDRLEAGHRAQRPDAHLQADDDVRLDGSGADRGLL